MARLVWVKAQLKALEGQQYPEVTAGLQAQDASGCYKFDTANSGRARICQH